MTFGEQVVGILKERRLLQHFRYAEIQALKAVPDAASTRAHLAEKGREAEDERTEPLHFAAQIEIHVLRRKLTGAAATILFFGFT